MDTQTERNIQVALERLIDGKTTFAIAHRLSTLQKADRLLVLDDGTFAEMGTHDELMQKRGVYFDLVNAQRATTRLRGRGPGGHHGGRRPGGHRRPGGPPRGPGGPGAPGGGPR